MRIVYVPMVGWMQPVKVVSVPAVVSAPAAVTVPQEQALSTVCSPVIAKVQVE
jgi:hypothetical protein